MSGLITAEQTYAMASSSHEPMAFACRRFIEAQMRERGLPVMVLGVPTETIESHPCRAYISLSRWVVDCSNPECWSAQVASETDHRFFCVDCLNVHVDGAFVRVEWPTAQEIADVERIMEPRLPHNRHWHPHLGETIDKLRAENAERKVEV